jgi:hypothetical protein
MHLSTPFPILLSEYNYECDGVLSYPTSFKVLIHLHSLHRAIRKFVKLYEVLIGGALLDEKLSHVG